MKILLPVDGSSYTKRMLAWLTTHDEWLTGQHEYTVLIVVPQIPPHAAAMFPADQLKSYYDDTAEAIFKPIRKFTAKHAPANLLLVEMAQRLLVDASLEIHDMRGRIPEIHPAPEVELGLFVRVQAQVAFLAQEAQQEPDLLLADAYLPFVAPDGPARKPIAQPARRRPPPIYRLSRRIRSSST